MKQDSNTSLLINDLRAIIYHLSNGLTIEAGDLISTGTPAGVGFARDPKEFLRPGDIVEVEVEGVGILRNPVVDIREGVGSTPDPWRGLPCSQRSTGSP